MSDKIFITPEQAISLLNEGDSIHTFRNPNGMLMGADWSRKEIIKALRSNPTGIQIGGEICRQMKHALIIEDAHGYLFIETNEQKLNELDPISL